MSAPDAHDPAVAQSRPARQLGIPALPRVRARVHQHRDSRPTSAPCRTTRAGSNPDPAVRDWMHELLANWNRAEHHAADCPRRPASDDVS
jgi:hypothetical protein